MVMQTGLQLQFEPEVVQTRRVQQAFSAAEPAVDRSLADALTGGHVPRMTSPDSTAATLLIIDGHAYAYRAFYAIRQLNSQTTGLATNAIYGFIRMLGKARGWLKPTHMVVMWDGGLAQERMDALPEYKAQRPSMPSDLERQIEEIFCWLEACNIPSFHKDGIEADDCIATLARDAAAKGVRVVIASSDKDFMQLIEDGKIGLLNPNDKTETLWFEEQVQAKMQVRPDQIVDYLALLGDSVDNIPGVPGVGAKTAAGLLQQFGSLDAIYARLDEVKSDKLRASLAANAEVARRNKEIVRLRTDIGCDLELDNYKLQGGDSPKLREFYQRCGFRTLLEELEKEQNRTLV